jgi:hypothetical protein
MNFGHASPPFVCCNAVFLDVFADSCPGFSQSPENTSLRRVHDGCWSRKCAWHFRNLHLMVHGHGTYEDPCCGRVMESYVSKSAGPPPKPSAQMLDSAPPESLRVIFCLSVLPKPQTFTVLPSTEAHLYKPSEKRLVPVSASLDCATAVLDSQLYVPATAVLVLVPHGMSDHGESVASVWSILLAKRAVPYR